MERKNGTRRPDRRANPLPYSDLINPSVLARVLSRRWRLPLATVNTLASCCPLRGAEVRQ